MTQQEKNKALSDKLCHSISSPNLSHSCFSLPTPTGDSKPSRELNSSRKTLPLWAAEAGEPKVPFVCHCSDCDLPKYLGNNGLLYREPGEVSSESEQRDRLQHMELIFRQSCNVLNQHVEGQCSFMTLQRIVVWFTLIVPPQRSCRVFCPLQTGHANLFVECNCTLACACVVFSFFIVFFVA